MEIKELTNTTFHDAIAGQTPVVVDFWASWCGPCKMFAPNFRQVAEELGDRAVFAKVNVDEADAVAAQCKIMSIPTVAVFKAGQMVKQTIGLMSAEDFKAFLQDVL